MIPSLDIWPVALAVAIIVTGAYVCICRRQIRVRLIIPGLSLSIHVGK